MLFPLLTCFFFFFNDTATTEIYTLSLHDALPISESSPIGVSSESGLRDDSRMSRTFLAGTPVRWASSSGVGSRPSPLTLARFTREVRFSGSPMCTGIRIVREWSAMAGVIARPSHHVAYLGHF